MRVIVYPLFWAKTNEPLVNNSAFSPLLNEYTCLSKGTGTHYQPWHWLICMPRHQRTTSFQRKVGSDVLPELKLLMVNICGLSHMGYQDWVLVQTPRLSWIFDGIIACHPASQQLIWKMSVLGKYISSKHQERGQARHQCHLWWHMVVSAFLMVPTYGQLGSPLGEWGADVSLIPWTGFLE